MKATRQPQRQAKLVAAKTPKPPKEKASAAIPLRLTPLYNSLPPAVFFMIYGLCLWLWINVGLIYHGSGQVQDFPSFYWGWSFVREFGTHPGGLLEYAAALLAQSLYLPWFGALVLTLQAAVIYGTLAGCISVAASRQSAAFLRADNGGALPRRRYSVGLGSVRILALVPPLLLLGIYSMYRHYSVPVSSFALGSVAAWVWWRWGSSDPLKRLWAASALVVLMYAVGPSALFVFLPAVLCHELLGPTRWTWFLLFLLLSALTPPIEGRLVFGFGAGEAFAKVLPLPWDPIVLKMSGVRPLIALYIFPTAFWLTIAIWQTVVRKKNSTRVPDALPLKEGERLGLTHRIKRHAWTLEFAACAVLPVAVVWVSLNSQLKALMQLDFYAWRGQWVDALAVSAKANSQSPYVACSVAQASYHTGQLLTQLPSLPSPADLLLYRNKQVAHWKASDLYYDLGYLNMALHHLTEAVEFYGERPPLLRRLALVNLALGNVSTAKVYLGTLARAPFQGEWANDYLQRLQLDPNLTTDEEVARLRRSMVRTDSVVVLTPDEELSMLLGANPQNRMAFEYLMTYYLLTKNLNGFVKNVSRINDFSNLSVPPMWDEALVLAGRMAGRQLQVPGHVISQEGVTRVENVTRAVKQAGDDAVSARLKLAPQYGHTYTFYWWFHE